MNHSIHFDLCDERLHELASLINEDVQAFVEEDLLLHTNYFNRIGDQIALEDELFDLVAVERIPSEKSLILVDVWASPFHGRLDLSIANHYKNLIHYIFLEFLENDLLTRIAVRFNLSKNELLQADNEARILDWMKLWMVEVYPNLLLFLFGDQEFKVFKRIGSLALHEVVLYLPAFVLWNLKDNLKNPKKRTVTFELAKGLNIRRVESFPVAFTKKMAHLFTNVPKEYSYDDAVWYAIVIGLHGNESLLNILKTHLRRWTKDLDYLKNLVSFFSALDKDLETNEMSQLLGYLQHIRQEEGKLNIKGWTLNSLRRRANNWYEALRNKRHLEYLKRLNEPEWEAATFNDFECNMWGKTFHIVQLKSSGELFEEGARMSHCVATYAYKCKDYGTSIWSLRRMDAEEATSLVTIEVSKNGRIMEASAKFNAAPRLEYVSLIQMWARREGIVF